MDIYELIIDTDENSTGEVAMASAGKMVGSQYPNCEITEVTKYAQGRVGIYAKMDGDPGEWDEAVTIEMVHGVKELE